MTAIADRLFPELERRPCHVVLNVTQWWCHRCDVGETTYPRKRRPDCFVCGETMSPPGLFWDPTSIMQWRTARQRARMAS